MATIALYAGKMNQMPSFIGEVKKSVDAYSSELFSLKSKALNIRKSVCDLDDIIEMVQASTEIQEQKVASVYKGQHASNRVISVIFSVILNRRTSSTPQSSALKSIEIPMVEVGES